MHHARQHKAARKMLERFEAWQPGALGAAGLSGRRRQALNRHLLNSAKSGDLNEASMALEASGERILS